ncbi:MAG: arylesterase [Nitratireductor sp.]|nr:arylesterase [Nitratireductor sp.]
MAVLLPAKLALAAQATIIAFGDSLVAGLGLPQEEAFPARLEAALRERGHDVNVVNAGVSGDTTAAGLGRLDWSVPDGTDGVIIELGANDMLRGIDPDQTRKNLDAMLARLAERKIPVLLAGMRAAPNLGAEYSASFDPIFPDLAQKYGAALYPFFLDGVAAEPGLNQPDGMHPNSAGVDVIVGRFLPVMEEFLKGPVRQAQAK